MGTDGGDGEARRALSNKLPRVLRGGGSEGAQGRREQATASTVLTLSQGDCGQVQVKRSNICLVFNLPLYEKNSHMQQLCNFHYKRAYK